MLHDKFNKAFGIAAAATLAGGVWLAGVPGAGSTAEAKELKLAHFVSPKHPMHRFLMAPMAKDVAKASKGKLTIKIYPAGALGKGPRQQYNRVVDRVADITFGLQGYTSPQFPRTLLAELPDVAMSAQDATKRIWRALPTHLAADYKDVKVLALWTNHAAILITRVKPIRRLADLKGLKIRAPSRLAAGVLKSWGAVPVTMPVTKVYLSMQTKKIDGVFIGPSAIRSFKLTEVGKYFTTNLPTAHTTFYLLMNKKSWNGLNTYEKGIINKASGLNASLRAATAYNKAGVGGMALAKKIGRTVIRLSDAERARFAKAAQPYVKRTIAAREGKGIKAKAVYSALKGK